MHILNVTTEKLELGHLNHWRLEIFYVFPIKRLKAAMKCRLLETWGISTTCKLNQVHYWSKTLWLWQHRLTFRLSFTLSPLPLLLFTLHKKQNTWNFPSAVNDTGSSNAARRREHTAVWVGREQLYSRSCLWPTTRGTAWSGGVSLCEPVRNIWPVPLWTTNATVRRKRNTVTHTNLFHYTCGDISLTCIP